MNPLDIAIIIVIVFLALKGLLRGFIREMALLLGIIVALIISYRSYPWLVDIISPYLKRVPYLNLISFSIIFFSVVAISNLIGLLIRDLVKRVYLGGIDRILGGALATIKGIILVYLGIVVISVFLSSNSPILKRSVLAPLVIKSYKSMVTLFSPHHLELLKKRLPEEIKEIEKRDEKQKQW
ncbi:MAG TPA: CvpA family protein [Desulfobacteraceae bacterium]|nr:CvpA family protein [Desulfobacteraceae bacterium]